MTPDNTTMAPETTTSKVVTTEPQDTTTTEGSKTTISNISTIEDLTTPSGGANTFQGLRILNVFSFLAMAVATNYL